MYFFHALSKTSVRQCPQVTENIKIFLQIDIFLYKKDVGENPFWEKRLWYLQHHSWVMKLSFSYSFIRKDGIFTLYFYKLKLFTAVFYFYKRFLLWKSTVIMCHSLTFHALQVFIFYQRIKDCAINVSSIREQSFTSEKEKLL